MYKYLRNEFTIVFDYSDEKNYIFIMFKMIKKLGEKTDDSQEEMLSFPYIEVV